VAVAAALPPRIKDARGSIQQRLLPSLMDLTRGCQSLTVRTPSNATGDLDAASWFLRFDFCVPLVLENQQDADRSFRHCPIFGGNV
jgi:hypothetical protein